MGYEEKQDLQDIIDEHNEPFEPYYECSKCMFVCKTEAELEKHLERCEMTKYETQAIDKIVADGQLQADIDKRELLPRALRLANNNTMLLGNFDGGEIMVIADQIASRQDTPRNNAVLVSICERYNALVSIPDPAKHLADLQAQNKTLREALEEIQAMARKAYDDEITNSRIIEPSTRFRAIDSIINQVDYPALENTDNNLESWITDRAYLVETGTGWEISFDSPNGLTGCVMNGENQLEYAKRIVECVNSLLGKRVARQFIQPTPEVKP